MRLNSQSWYARWYRLICTGDLPTDLGSYVWRWLRKTLFIVLCGGSLVVFVLAASYGKGLEWFGHWWGIFLLLGMIGLGLSAISAVAAMVLKTRPPESVLLLRPFLKAKKERYCPVIAWKREE